MTADELRACLTRLGWSQRELMRELQVGLRTVQDWARGHVPVPDNVASWLRTRADNVRPAGWEARKPVTEEDKPPREDKPMRAGALRTGIVGDIYGYAEGPAESHGQGLDEDAIAISRRYPDQTVHFVRADGRERWFEAGLEIREPDWFNSEGA